LVHSSRALSEPLNETQESILNVVFDVADKQGLLLIDLMDLRAMLNYVAAHAAPCCSKITRERKIAPTERAGMLP